jgi:flavin reductase (DIM6/NTAB) family NADH-FMN oxidoreductase RutF
MNATTQHIEVNLPVLYVGTPVALITTLNENDTANISPMSSAWALVDRVVLGMSSTSKGRENAVRERELVINFPEASQWANVEALARSTGRDPVPSHKRAIGYQFDSSKFETAGLTPQQSRTVRPPRILQCPLQLEARVVAVHEPGLHWPSERPESFQIIETMITKVHAHSSIVGDPNRIDVTAWKPLFYVFRHYFSTGADLGKTFKA